MDRRNLTDTARHFGGVEATARWQGHAKATGEALLAPVRNHRSKVGSITGEPGK
jgi:hypothetical protein